MKANYSFNCKCNISLAGKTLGTKRESPQVCRRLTFLRGLANDKRPGYSPRVRERAVRLVLTGEHEHKSRWAAIQSVADRIGCTPETLWSWVNKMGVDSSHKFGVTSTHAARLKELERENRELKRANEILRKAEFFSSRRSSTANRSDDRIYPPRARNLRCRANLRDLAD